MREQSKSAQLQIRVSPTQKATIQRAARQAGLEMSAYVLGKVLHATESRLQELLRELMQSSQPAFALAAINDVLSGLTGDELKRAVAAPPPPGLSAEQANYVAAMIELAANRSGMAPPDWVRSIPLLERPLFGSELESLRLYLLTHSPPPFRKRNIFVDTSLGGRV